MGGIDYDIRDKVLEQEVANIKPMVNQGTINNAADEEDLTSENNLLKLKDRSALNGMGYVILRKNKTFAEQVTKANTIYEIRYDFDLNNKSIDLPSGCIINFVGGNLSNGTIKGNVIVCGEHSSQMVFVDGYNLNEQVVVSSNIGLVANNADAASHNTAILAKCIALNKTLTLDDTYHFNSNGLEISGKFSIVGSGKLITSRSGYFFILKENASLELNGIEIYSQAERFISGENLDYQIDSLCMTHCKYRGRRLTYLTFQDLDFATTPFGFKKFIFEDNDVESEGSFVLFSDAVISEICSIRRNRIHNMKHSCFFFGATEEFANAENNIKKWCDMFVEDNIVDGGISNNVVSYCTFLLAEVNSVYYRRNVIKNVLAVGTGIAYDAYVSSWKYVSEDNVFENIACIPPTGTPKDTADEFGKGKQRCELRYFRNNRWKNDYSEIRRILADYLTALDDETYRKVCYVALFAYTAPVQELVFINNTIEVIDGDLWGTQSTVDIERATIENNIFFCDTKYSLFSTKDGNIAIRNNIFKGTSERTDYNLIMSTNTIQSIIVENNVFDLSWRVNESLKAKNVYVKNNTYANLKGIKGNVYIPNGEDSSDFEYVWHTDEADKKIFCSNGRIICPKESAAIRRVFSTKKENVKIDITIPRIDVKLSYIFKVENGTTKIYDVDGNLLYTPTSQLGYTLYEKNGIRFWGSAASNGLMEFYLLIQKQQDVIVDINSRDVTFNQVKVVGVQSDRPNTAYISAGYQYFDKTLKKPIWWNGESWVDATGASV